MSQVKWDDSKLKAEVREFTMQRLAQAAETVVTICKRSMGSGQSGHRPYKKTKKEILHWSSVPPEPPHVDTGRLRASITWAISEGSHQGTALINPSTDPDNPSQESDAVQKPAKNANAVIAIVGTNVKYARALEFGFEPRKLAARPYLRPALEQAIAKIKWLFYRE